MTQITKTRENTLAVPSREKDGRWLEGTSSPNPKGRPSVPIDVKVAAKTYTQDMIDVLVDVALNPKSPPSARVAAANAILDRGHGRATQPMEATVEKIDFAQIHLEVLKEMSEAGRRDQQRRGFVPPSARPLLGQTKMDSVADNSE